MPTGTAGSTLITSGKRCRRQALQHHQDLVDDLEHAAGVDRTAPKRQSHAEFGPHIAHSGTRVEESGRTCYLPATHDGSRRSGKAGPG